MKVDVRDDYVRNHVPGFDGRERVFVLIPQDSEGQQWARADLKYERTLQSPAIGASSTVTWQILRLLVNDIREHLAALMTR
ncbi:MAG: hypothetical protein H6729_08110, partial [Deltaproteobacteria bacterium]|nr:hypothetical protein [Deltaproteobacteria bacterium]